jgi:hypothetical protein
VRRIALFATATAVYLMAAWMVAPGFFEGFAPPEPYHWTCPPPQAGFNQKPSSGHTDIKVVDGVSDAYSAFTGDSQAVIGFLPGSFDATGKSVISVDVMPLSNCPQPPGIKFVTNVYYITANARLVKPPSLVLRYSNLLPDPSDVYSASSPDGPWTGHPRNQQAQMWTAEIRTPTLGYFAAGYQQPSPPSGTVRIGGNQLLPIVVAALIVLVVLAGVPLAVLRRRRDSDEGGDES